MEDSVSPLATFSLTQIHYDPSDPLSLMCAWLALMPQALCIVYVTLIFATREMEVVLLFAGQMACEAVNFGLKRLFKEQRPARFQGRGYGMPSSHAQFVAFWAVSVALFLLWRHQPPAASVAGPGPGPGPGSVRLPAPRSMTAAAVTATSAAILAVAGCVAWSRVYLSYHTPRQVLAGIGAGAICALVWFALVSLARRAGLLDWALDLSLARYLRMRDLLLHEDPWQAGWERSEQRRHAGILHKQT